MSIDYTDLRNKTVFNFTDNPKIIIGEFGIMESRAEYEAYAREHMPMQTRIFNLIGIAELLQDKELEAEISKQFAEELKAWGFE